MPISSFKLASGPIGTPRGCGPEGSKGTIPFSASDSLLRMREASSAILATRPAVCFSLLVNLRPDRPDLENPVPALLVLVSYANLKGQLLVHVLPAGTGAWVHQECPDSPVRRIARGRHHSKAPSSPSITDEEPELISPGRPPQESPSRRPAAASEYIGIAYVRLV